jgi:signal transduction histidine kinase
MPSTPQVLLLSPVFEAIEAWLAAPDDARGAALGAAIVRVGEQLGLDVGEVTVDAHPLPVLRVNPGDARGDEHALRASGETEPLGSVRIDGDPAQATALVHALELLFVSARARTMADRSAAQLRAVEVAVRGIGGVLDHERVLQLIADRVRELAQARYAAIGIVDRDGVIERFITSGMTDKERTRIGPLPRGRGLLGLIIREERTYRIRDIATHPERFGFPPNHPVMHSFLGVPITSRGVPVGRLYLTDKQGSAEFSAEDEALVDMFALHAGIAIENARLHDQVRRLAIVDERDRISRDLHDSVIQAIYAQTLSLDDVPVLVEDDPDEARRRVDEAIDALHAVIRDIRNFIFGLRPVLLESGSLADGLAHLATELRRNGAIEVSVTIQAGAGPLETLPIELVAELLAVTREALSNIARHAQAGMATVILDGSPEELRLEITDDGRGFEADRLLRRGHHGLVNMRARTEAIGGRFDLDSGTAGTRIIIALPRPTAAIEGDNQ